jgi:hypothetical protein
LLALPQKVMDGEELQKLGDVETFRVKVGGEGGREGGREEGMEGGGLFSYTFSPRNASFINVPPPPPPSLPPSLPPSHPPGP